MSDSTRFGTPNAATLRRIEEKASRFSAGRMSMLLGSGKTREGTLLEAQALDVETVAAGRYDGAPAMQVTHPRHD